LPVRFKANDQTKVGESSRTDELSVAIEQATQRDVGIISISQVTATTPRLEQALQSALDKDVIVVAGVGNRPKDVFIQYPAKYRGVVAVGASGRNGKVASVSVTGREMVISAPGVDMVSTDGVGGYRIGTGTSDATAIVAGAAALVRSRYPKLSASEVVHRLTATATDKGAPGRDDQYGFGSLNLVAALTAKVPPAVPDTSPTAATPAPSESTTAPVTAGDDVSLKPNGAFFIVIGVLLLGVLAGVGAVVWLIVRSRRRQVSPTRSTTFR
jgi:subtilisin family serine protease